MKTARIAAKKLYADLSQVEIEKAKKKKEKDKKEQKIKEQSLRLLLLRKTKLRALVKIKRALHQVLVKLFFLKQ